MNKKIFLNIVILQCFIFQLHSMEISHTNEYYIADQKGFLPLHTAAQENNLNLINTILSHDLDLIEFTTMKEGLTPLHCACESENIQATECLLKFGADMHQQNNDGITPLMVAIQKQNICLLKLLLRNTTNINLSNNGKQGILHIAYRVDNKKIIRLLLDHDADPFFSTYDGSLPFNRILDTDVEMQDLHI